MSLFTYRDDRDDAEWARYQQQKLEAAREEGRRQERERCLKIVQNLQDQCDEKDDEQAFAFSVLKWAIIRIRSGC